MREALYRKYRSKSLDEIVGQEHITTTLSNAVKSGKISHAYLFTGPRGVGKTSIARILAHEINGIPYSKNTVNLDIIEIDAASNRRIDEIRELRDKVHVAPTSTKYKVYIIDEVHMLTREAFNALLKTLEEPPEHVVFILATTEAHKLPETIISRTQRFTFKPIDEQAAIKHLKKLAKAEKIDIDDEALKLVVEHAQGSFRDSISLLDQLSGQGSKITENDVRLLVGIPPENTIGTLFTSLTSYNAADAIGHVKQLYESGYQPAMIASSLSRFVHKKLIDSNEYNPALLAFSRELLAVPSASNQQVALEIALLDIALDKSAPAHPEQTEPTATQPPEPVTEAATSSTSRASSTNENKPLAKGSLQKQLDQGLWDKTLGSLKGRYNTLYGIARMCSVSASGQTLIMSFEFPFHFRRCNETRNKKRISEIVSQLAGQDIEIEPKLASKSKTPAATKHKATKEPKSDTLDSITEVFGGGEILD